MTPCPTCNGTGETTQPLPEIGTVTAPCPDCGGTKLASITWKVKACDHADTVPGFMPGTRYCKLCPAKIILNPDGSIADVIERGANP